MDVLRLFEESVRREASIERKPPDPADVLATWADIPYTYADISKARRLLGYNPTISVQEGITRALSWYEEAVLGGEAR